MEVSKETIDKIAHLSRLELSENDKQAMTSDLTNIVTWMEQLNEVDTTNVEPLIHMSEAVNAFREDEAKNTLSRAEALLNAPESDDAYFMVPKVID